MQEVMCGFPLIVYLLGQVKMADLKKYVIGTLTAALLVSLMFSVLPTDTHFCRSLEISRECDRLSSTELTCYPYPETTVGKKYCSSGWEVLLKEEQKIKEVNQGRKECCSPGQMKCTEGACK